jgi:mono/diheme cytochrome c family protein
MTSTKLKLLALTALLFTLPACGPSDRAVSIADMTGEATSGAALYTMHCASCHGASARGGSGPNLISELGEEDDADLIDVVLEGDGDMPSFSNLEDQEIADIMAHLHSL